MGCVTGWDRPSRKGTGVGNTDHDRSPDHCPQPSGELRGESPQTLCAKPTPHSPTLTCVLSPSDYSTFYMTKGQPAQWQQHGQKEWLEVGGGGTTTLYTK